MEQEINSVSQKENAKVGIGKRILYGIFSALFLGLTSATLLIIFLQKFIKDDNSIGMLSFISILVGFIAFFIVGYRYATSVEGGVVKVYTGSFPIKEQEFRRKISFLWGLAFVMLIVIIPGIVALTKYRDFTPYVFSGGFFIFLIGMAIKFLKSQEAPVLTEAPSSTIQQKTNLGTFESIAVLIWVLATLVLYTVARDSSTLLQLQKIILFIWLIFSGMWLYRKARFFGGETMALSESESLTTNQKIAIALLSVISAPVVGVISIFIWKNSSLIKARRANLISIVVFILEIALVFGYLAITQG